MAKKFSKEKWLECAMAQKEKGRISQAEIDHASETWVAQLDGYDAKLFKETTGCDLDPSWCIDAEEDAPDASVVDGTRTGESDEVQGA